MDFQVIGKRKPIQDAALKVTGRKVYTADMKLPGMLYGKILFSPYAHADIVRIDTSRAEALPGVYAVATYRNAPDVRYNSAKRMIDLEAPRTEKIFDNRVRFVGDRVAAVAAESEQIAAAALKLIDVEYRPLPAYLSIAEALKPGARPIHGGSNIVARMETGEKIPESVFAACDHVIEGRYTTPPIHHAAIEPHCALADWNPQGKLTVYTPTQNSFAFRVILSEIFGLPFSKIRVVAPAVGGAFGGKLEMTVEPVAALLSRMAGRPVKIVLSRRETMMATRVRHGSVSYVKTGFSNDGIIQAMDFRIYTNTGAYATSAMNVAGALMHKIFLAYQVPRMHIQAIPVYTNTLIGGAMRGYGSPQVYFGMQRQVNCIAKILGVDPLQVQLNNMVDPDSRHPESGQPLGNPRPKDCLRRAAQLIDYPAARKAQAESRQAGGRFAIGVGLALGVHGNNCFGVHRDNTSPMIKMNEDGSCTFYTGAHEMGNDSIGMQMQILSETIGVPMAQIDAVAADTDACLWHIGDYSSRGVFVTGAAMQQAAGKMKQALQEEAAGLLGIPPAAIALSGGFAFEAANPAHRVSLRDVMIHCQSAGHGELCVHATYETTRSAGSYGVHIAKVRVDRETGKVQVLQYAAVQDVGFAINPLMLEGQLQGGIHMGLGYALSEQMTFDEQGRPQPLLLKKYGILRADEMPQELKIDFITGKGGEPGGPHGAKALGECPVVPVAPAVVNAICNALEIEMNDLPATPERILAALRKKEETQHA